MNAIKIKTMLISGFLAAFAIIVVAAGTTFSKNTSSTDTESEKPTPYVREKLGNEIPLDLVFQDEQGNDVVLRDLLTKPTALVLVYYRCPGICSPLLQEVASVVDKCDYRPGPDYQLWTISFDAREDQKLSSIAHDTIVGALKNPIPPDSWRFMTGNEENIKKLTRAVGFGFVPNKEDFIHSAVVTFISKEGIIVRYLHGLEILPADMKLAVQDAIQGHERSMMRKIQQLCFSYDPVSRKFVLRLNRVILAASLVFMTVFISLLVFRGKKHPHQNISERK